MNLADPELELVDPTPNVHSLFIHFDKVFFWTKLASRAVVRWSKRMYSCAGICSYDRGGLCDIALSEPLLKLRPRKDLVETLLHEMIHAFLFVTNRDQDRDGHGPNFQAHMHRINRSAGINITIYHDFHDEVKLYQTHWWRCNGPCQRRRPHFGIVRRTANRAPGPKDFWWNDHKRKCGGTFMKIKEPENYGKKNTKAKPKPSADITKYIETTDNIKTINDITPISSKPVLKDNNIATKGNIKTKSNNSNTVVVTKKDVGFNPVVPKPKASIPIFTGNGHTIRGEKNRSNTIDVTEAVRNVWANKQLPEINTINTTTKAKIEIPKPNKHKSSTIIQSPPTKIKKIDDYFKTTATSVLKELYGEDFKLVQPSNTDKILALSVKVDLVDCPICNAKINSEEINRHLDECLNRDVIKELSQNNSDRDNKKIPEPSTNRRSSNSAKPNNFELCDTVDLTHTRTVDRQKDTQRNKKSVQSNPELKIVKNETIDLTEMKLEKDHSDRRNDFERRSLTKHNTIEYTPIVNTKSETTKIRRSDSFVTIQRGDTLTTKAGTSTSKEPDVFAQNCPCCGKKFDKPVVEHLDECLIFFDNNNTVPKEGASTSYVNGTIVINDIDELDETVSMNATGTKTPCPCCMEMVEESAMNDHLDVCLQS